MRLPRLRGDGPRAGRGRWWLYAASPPARGWTRHDHPRYRRRIGFPACAGMDPPHAAARQPSPRLPRLRGDGPHREQRHDQDYKASPPARGWTLALQKSELVIPGFPACAGMDPFRASATARDSRLPRLRGDGPLSRAHSRKAREASPPARGWTRRLAAEIDVTNGFPACAGMDPPGCRRSAPPSWLPRLRGDGPSRTFMKARTRKSPDCLINPAAPKRWLPAAIAGRRDAACRAPAWHPAAGAPGPPSGRW